MLKVQRDDHRSEWSITNMGRYFLWEKEHWNPIDYTIEVSSLEFKSAIAVLESMLPYATWKNWRRVPQAPFFYQQPWPTNPRPIRPIKSAPSSTDGEWSKNKDGRVSERSSNGQGCTGSQVQGRGCVYTPPSPLYLWTCGTARLNEIRSNPLLTKEKTVFKCVIKRDLGT